MTKERELLERAFESMKNRTLLTENERNLEKEISYYLLSTPEPTQESKPIAFWDTQEGTLIPAVPLSSERTCFKVPLIPLYLHPRADIVDELVETLKGLIESTTHICEGAYGPGMDGSFDKARAALKKLEEE